MGLRGPTPKSATYHKLNGTCRPSRHGPLPERTAAMRPSELSEAEQEARKRELEAQRTRLYGESGLPDGSARRIRW